MVHHVHLILWCKCTTTIKHIIDTTNRCMHSTKYSKLMNRNLLHLYIPYTLTLRITLTSDCYRLRLNTRHLATASNQKNRQRFSDEFSWNVPSFKQWDQWRVWIRICLGMQAGWGVNQLTVETKEGHLFYSIIPNTSTDFAIQNRNPKCTPKGLGRGCT